MRLSGGYGGGGGNSALPQLRFEVGAKVECRVGPTNDPDSWALGEVVKHWYREQHWPRHRTAPYQIRLDSGQLIFAPVDDDKVIRAVTGVLADGKVPVTVLTGFLGSGKTTLLNYILKENHGKKYAVIENEVGAVGVDNQLLASTGYDKSSTEESITLLDNGCLCCTVRGDLVDAIKGIVEKANRKPDQGNKDSKLLDGILIETTGVADPGPICKTFYGDPFCSTYCRIDGVITVVDSVNFVTQLTRERSKGAVNESAQQIAFADKVLLNKVDAASKEGLQQAVEAIRQVNEFVPITKCSLGKNPAAVPLPELLSIDAFDLKKMLEDGDIDLAACGVVQESAPSEEQGHGDGHCEGHGDGHCDGHGDGHDNEGHGDGHEGGHGGGHDGGHGSGHGAGHGAGHGDGHAAGHGHSVSFRHDTGISSFVCELEGTPLDPMKFNDWMSDLLQKSEDLYRFKGILAMVNPRTGVVQKRVLQGVHDMVDMDGGVEWPEELGIKSQVVVIGRNLKPEWRTQFAKLAHENVDED